MLVTLVAPTVATSSAQAAQGSLPQTIALPGGWQPEGIASGRGATFYVGSLANGAIWRGNFRSGQGEVLYPGRAGDIAVGIDYDVRGNRVWAAKGPTGQATVHDAATGRLLQTYQLTAPDAGFINDVIVTRHAVYFTDSFQQLLHVVPLDRRGRLPDPDAAFSLPLTGDIHYVADFNANGIVAAAGGRFLVIVQSNTGLLFRVDPASGVTRQIDLGGKTLTGGDGLELSGRTLYVVRGSNQVAVVRLGGRLTSGRVVSTITDPRLDFPTTATLALGRLWVVNARFATPPTPETLYTVVQLRRR
jgi:hypothetical protein